MFVMKTTTPYFFLNIMFVMSGETIVRELWGLEQATWPLSRLHGIEEGHRPLIVEQRGFERVVGPSGWSRGVWWGPWVHLPSCEGKKEGHGASCRFMEALEEGRSPILCIWGIEGGLGSSETLVGEIVALSRFWLSFAVFLLMYYSCCSSQ